jgi:hypothetical protein
MSTSDDKIRVSIELATIGEPELITSIPTVKRPFLTSTKIYDDRTIEKTNEDILSEEFRVHGGGVQSDALADYLDNIESKNKNDRKKDGKQANNSSTSNQSQ